MGIVLDRGRFYWVKRVPKRYHGLVVGQDGEPVSQVRQALHTDSRAEAIRKAAKVEAARMAEWNALAVGDRGSARAHYEAARNIAAAYGFSYTPIADLSTGDIAEILARVQVLGTPESPAPREVARAIGGAVPVAHPDLDGAFQEYLELTTTRHLQKSDAQKHRWKTPRMRAVRNFQDQAFPDTSPPAVDQITRADVLRFRAWWAARVESGMSAKTANKEFGHLKEIFSTWSGLSAPDLKNPFSGLSLEGVEGNRTPPFSRTWIKSRILADGAIDGLNPEAADVLLVLINTGLRPSEVTDAPLDDYRVRDNVPHLRVAPNGRELKVAHTRRDIPLVGVSLEAARRIVARGGILRYRNKASGWSALVNKFLENNGLKETPKHSAYSLRHYVEDALLAAGVDDRVRADILGHKYHRPVYGEGGGLVGRRDALLKISL